MAKTIKEKLKSNIAVSFTGNAGPTLSEGKEAGLVYSCVLINEEKYFYKDILPSDAKEVAKIQFKDELKDLIKKNNAESSSEWSWCVKQVIKSYKDIATKEAVCVLAYASQLFDLIQKGRFNKESLDQELKTPCLKKIPNGCLFFFKDIFSSSKVRY